MKNQEWLIFGVVAMLLCAGIMFRIYRHQYAGRPQLGWHLQIVAVLIACAGVALALVFHVVQIGAAAVLAGAILSIVGMCIHVASNRQFEDDQRDPLQDGRELHELLRRERK